MLNCNATLSRACNFHLIAIFGVYDVMKSLPESIQETLSGSAETTLQPMWHW